MANRDLSTEEDRQFWKRMDKIVRVGSIVQWSNGRKPLGTVCHLFRHRDEDYAVVVLRSSPSPYEPLFKVVRVYEQLLALGMDPNFPPLPL